MALQSQSPCKINLLLNILGRRGDGFHELETVMQPVPLFDEIQMEKAGREIVLSCNNSELPLDSRNLVYRAAQMLRAEAGITDGLRIHLTKKIPLAAGLGGGSGNAAVTLRMVNSIFGNPLPPSKLEELAGRLGSDVPFFLGVGPALATGRGEKIEKLSPLTALNGLKLLLVHPGFGISTAWAYQSLAKYPDALNGKDGRARSLITALEKEPAELALQQMYNSLEAPALEKYPVLRLYQEFFLSRGAVGTLMSGSGSTTFAIFRTQGEAENATESYRKRFGEPLMLEIVPFGDPPI
jgi:4-diphosphocytidyl-2-C-methyl-D-erythritol kinase